LRGFVSRVRCTGRVAGDPKHLPIRRVKPLPFTENQFEQFVRAGHALFELFEARWDFYPIAARAVSDWLSTGSFELPADTCARVSAFAQEAYDVFGIKPGQETNRFEAQRARLANALAPHQHQNVGLAVAPYFFTWNLRRFIEYLRRRRDFDLVAYFENLGSSLGTSRSELSRIAQLELLRETSPPDARLWDSIHEQLKILGISQNEPVGTIKILHIFAPRYFPLLDNPIAKSFGLVSERESLTKALYFGRWLPGVQAWLCGFGEAPHRLESEFGESFLKLLDEAFYVANSIKLSRRASQIGLNL